MDFSKQQLVSVYISPLDVLLLKAILEVQGGGQSVSGAISAIASTGIRELASANFKATNFLRSAIKNEELSQELTKLIEEFLHRKNRDKIED